MDELKAAAKKGDLHAQSELGQWLLAKPASPYDHQHSEHWLLMAAEDNHPGTQVLLGRLCWEGLLKDYSNRRALYWLDKAMIFGRPSTRGSKTALLGPCRGSAWMVF
jgi:TPR repeat protein